MLMRYEFLPLASLDDVEQAAALYRHCRRSGLTIRGMNDCVIAAVAIRTGAAVLHFDRDFDAMAKLTTLRTCPRSSHSDRRNARNRLRPTGPGRQVKVRGVVIPIDEMRVTASDQPVRIAN